MRVLVTAGPTWEFIDEVRYLASPSTGRMGLAVAEVFARAGHKVDLVSGPTHLPVPLGVNFVSVVNARQMHDAALGLLAEADAVVMTAAVSDYRPAETLAGKKKRTGDKWVLELVENPDILKEIGQKKGNRILVGFAVESQSPRQHALEKLVSKNLDFIVLNSPEAFGVEVTSVEIIDRDVTTTKLEQVTKHDVAKHILKKVKKLEKGKKRSH